MKTVPRIASSVCILFLLAGCGGPVLPYSKDAPAEGDAVKPPWEAMVQAGPGAENDLDLDTLNGPLVKPLEPEAPAASADLRPSAEPDDTELAVKQEPEDVEPAPDPESKKKKGVAIKAVAVPTVTGAPGKGNAELLTAMRDVLKSSGWPVLAAKREDALTISGKVSLAKPEGAVQKVKLVWVVSTPGGKVIGDIVQENEVPAGSLDGGFGENARFAVEAAASGIFELIQKFR
jgi:hypothetical protein